MTRLKSIGSFIPLWRTWQQYRGMLGKDILAGITGAIAGAPQAMGFALVAGVSPIYGLYTALVSTIIGALICGTNRMTVGPTNALALVVGSTLVNFNDGSQIERMFVLTILAGVFQLAFGLLRLGYLVRFVSNAVMTGFISGAGILIILGQLQHVTGVTISRGTNKLVDFWQWLRHLEQADPHTVIIGITATLIIFTLHHTRFKGIATLVGITVTTLMIVIFGWSNVPQVKELSPIAGGLPNPIWPQFQYAPDLMVAALAIAVLASVQSASLAEAISESEGAASGTTRDLIGQGIANIVNGFFQGIPAGGSLSRTAVNIAAGAATRMANVFAGLLVGLVLISLGPVVERIALAALAGHLIVAALSLINVPNIQLVWSVNPSARSAMIATFVSTLVFPLEYSVYIGVIISLGLYVYTSADNIHIVRMILTADNHFREVPVPDTLPDSEPVLLSVSGNLFFGAARHLEEILPSPNGIEHPVVILRLRDNVYLGSTGIRILERYADQLEAQGGKLILAGVSDPVWEQMARAGVMERFGSENVFIAGNTVFSATERAWDYAHRWLHSS